MDVLGVSPDGGRVLFDQDKGRIDLVNLADGQTAGQLSNVGPTAAFATLAVFGPDHGTPDEPHALHDRDGRRRGRPEGRRCRCGRRRRPAAAAAEIARLITPGRVAGHLRRVQPAARTCRSWWSARRPATVHLWTPPSEPARKLDAGGSCYIDATDPRYVTVRVEMSNKELDAARPQHRDRHHPGRAQ